MGAPTDHIEVLTYLVCGAVPKELHSSEDDVTLQIEPEKAALTDKEFAMRKLTLVCLSYNIFVTPLDKDTPNNALIICKFDKPIKANIVLRSANSYEDNNRKVVANFSLHIACASVLLARRTASFSEGDDHPD